jgi:hypothetical protein
VIHDQFCLRPIIVFFYKTARKREEKGVFSVATVAIEVQHLCLLHLLAAVPLSLHRSASRSHAPLVVITRSSCWPHTEPSPVLAFPLSRHYSSWPPTKFIVDATPLLNSFHPWLLLILALLLSLIAPPLLA